ncbi:hypothetical protein [Pararhodonellum marinum]|uniref:hypothetical protein n=1 Tax=Pararhodonellum marinum TaxID=2755358 RepID=UPI00188EB138|nr:hypothetical protein [Pararhodonellum marinum]
MKDKIEALLDKYWAGESSLEEEQELRSLISKSSDFPSERLFFEDLATLSQIEPAPLPAPKNKPVWLRPIWQSAAAVLLFLAASFLVFQNQEKQTEAEAYEQVMQALSLIQQNMQKGTGQLEPISSFRYLNTSHEIFDLKE